MKQFVLFTSLLPGKKVVSYQSDDMKASNDLFVLMLVCLPLHPPTPPPPDRSEAETSAQSVHYNVKAAAGCLALRDEKI